MPIQIIIVRIKEITTAKMLASAWQVTNIS